MDKNIINLTNFLLDTNKLENFCEYKEKKLTIISGLLQADITSDIETPDFIKISIREYGMSNNKYLVSEIIPALEAKQLISKFWNKVEEKKNWQFIEDYGVKEYNRFREAYISAFKGEKEHSEFKIEIHCDDYEKQFLLIDKKFGLTNSAMPLHKPELYFNDDNIEEKVSGAIPIQATALIQNQAGTSFKAAQFMIFIPNIEANEYGFDLSVSKKYTDENMLEYLISKVREPNNKKVLSHLQLQNELQENINEKLVKPFKL